jgi:hypothetical protein
MSASKPSVKPKPPTLGKAAGGIAVAECKEGDEEDVEFIANGTDKMALKRK